MLGTGEARDGSARRLCTPLAPKVATGGRATTLPIPGVDLPGVITSDEALALPKQPEKMVVLGGGSLSAGRAYRQFSKVSRATVQS